MDSYATGETTPALLEETIGANLESTVASYADREALVECASGRRWTWAELDRDVDALARGLIGAGLLLLGPLAWGFIRQTRGLPAFDNNAAAWRPADDDARVEPVETSDLDKLDQPGHTLDQPGRPVG